MRTLSTIACLSLGLAVACGGDDDGGGNPDASGNNIDANNNQADADLTPDADTTPDAAVEVCGVDPCGGDIVGEWTGAGQCYIVPPDPKCPGLEITVDAEIAGGVTFDDVKVNTYDIAFDQTLDVVYYIPTACLGGATCDQISDPPDFVCTDGDGGCDCNLTIEDTTEEVGTWETDGNVLTLTPEGGEPFDLDYCVDGTTLTIQSQSLDELFQALTFEAAL